MGNKTSCPVQGSPIYDATTCKSFVGTGCPAPVSPVYDETTCKSFVGTGCPAPVSPIYDATTCASVIKTAVDAKKCTPIFGLPYNDSNENVKKVLGSLQNVINKIQEIVCTSQLKYFVLGNFLIKNTDTNTKRKSSAETKDQMNIKIDEMGIFSDIDLKESDLKRSGVTRLQLDDLKILLKILVDVVITVNTVDGGVNVSTVNQTMTDIVNSFCLDYKQQGFVLFASDNEVSDYDIIYLNNVGSTYINKSFSSLGHLQNDFVEKIYKSSVRKIDELRMFVNYVITNDIFNGLNANRNGLVFSLDKGSRKKIIVATPPVTTVLKSTFGSMSSFGETCGCWTWIILLILVLAIVGYILYHNRAVLKIPGLPHRIAAFGRQIKTIKRM